MLTVDTPHQLVYGCAFYLPLSIVVQEVWKISEEDSSTDLRRNSNSGSHIRGRAGGFKVLWLRVDKASDYPNFGE